jgi:RNA recognition motif-containing protein
VLHRSDPPVQSATNAIPDTEMEASSSSFGVVISNLSSQATEEDIKESFSFCGAFRSLTLRPCVDHRATAAEPASC